MCLQVCAKVFQSKRKAFDSQKHRVVGTEQAKFVKPSSSSNKLRDRSGSQSSSLSTSAKGKKSVSQDHTPFMKGNNVDSKPKWKQQSESFREMLKQNRIIKQAQDKGM